MASIACVTHLLKPHCAAAPHSFPPSLSCLQAASSAVMSTGAKLQKHLNNIAVRTQRFRAACGHPMLLQIASVRAVLRFHCPASGFCICCMHYRVTFSIRTFRVSVGAQRRPQGSMEARVPVGAESPLRGEAFDLDMDLDGDGAWGAHDVYSVLSLIFAASLVCHCMLCGASAPPCFSACTWSTAC